MKRDLTFPALPASAGRAIPEAWRRALPPLALALVWIVAWYWATAAQMVRTWANTETYAHGFVVAPIALWLVYRMRDRLRALTPRPSLIALPLVAGAGFVWLLGEFGGVNAVSQTAFVAMLVLTVPAILGVAVARAMMFPLGFLFFAVPVGDFLLPVLMERTADFTILALRASGVPVYREGLHFVIPTGRWSVIEACSGVRYLIASLMTGTLFAYISYRAYWRRWAFVGVAIAVPIVANWLRAYMIVMIGHLTNNALATGVDHIVYGWLFFGVVMLLMFWIGSHWHEAPVASPAPAPPSPAPAPSTPASSRWPVVVGLLAATSIWPLISAGTRVDDAGRNLALQAVDVPGWTAARDEDRPAFVPQFKAPSATLQEVLRRGDGTVGVYVAYYRGQDSRRKLVSSENVLVPSEGSPWIVAASGARKATIGQSPHDVVTARLHGPGEQQLVAWRWYWIDGDVLSSDIVAKARLAWSRLSGRGDDAAAIVIYTPVRGQQDPTPVLQAFAHDAWPRIATVLGQAGERR